MRIVHILHGNVYAGMEKFCIDLCNELSKSHDVKLIAGECFKGYISKNVDYSIMNLKKSRNNPLFLYELYKLIKEFTPDIMHGHKQKSIEILKRLAPFLHTPFVATKHDTKVKKAFYGLDYAISISDETTKTIKAKNIFKIFNGIPYEVPQKISMPKEFNIIAVGGLKRIKEFRVLIQSVSKLTFPFHLTIVGEGVLRDTLTNQIKELDIEDKVSLVGFKLNVKEYLYSSDLQVISSKSEGFSLAMIEGIFYSKVLISTKVSGCTEILSDDLLYDIENLTEKINDVYENKERYEKSFDEVKETYKERLTIEACAKEHLNVYEKIIKGLRLKKDIRVKLFNGERKIVMYNKIKCRKVMRGQCD
jgi:glycosyltransferase involved in cell wall biosynthesis